MANESKRKTKEREGNKFANRKGSYDGRGIGITKPCAMDKLRTNDVAYYNKYPEDFKVVTQVPTWWKVYGAPSGLGTCIDVSNATDMSLPVGMRIDVIPGPGTCTEPTDSVNRAFTVLMSDLYAKSSSSSLPFQQADLAIITLCVESISNMIATAKRALSFTSNWLTTNKFYPIAVEQLMGFNYQDLIRNKANYIERLNSSIHRFNAMRFPVKFDVMKRHYAMFHNVYADEDSAFAQLYVFHCRGTYEYDDENGQAKYVDVTPDTYGKSMDAYLQLLEEHLDKLMNSSDLYTINGALQRAYADGEFASIGECSLTDTIAPVVDRTILMQIMNADIRANVDVGTFNITQAPDKNTIQYKPFVTLDKSKGVYNPLTDSGEQINHFLRAYDNTVSADDNMEFTRLANTCNLELVNGKEAVSLNVGTEFVLALHVGRFSANDGSYVEKMIASNVFDTSSVASAVDELGALSPFRYLPMIIVGEYDSSKKTIANLSVLGDLYNYTTVSYTDLNRLTKVALDSIWRPI